MTTLIAVYNSEGCVGRCDAKCYEAKEPHCTCICGGRNHGAGLQKAIENTRECFEQWIEDYAESQGLKEYYGEVHQQVLQLTFFDLLTPSTGERRMIDTIHHYRPEWSGIQAHCRLRIRAHRGKDVVIASELTDNPGMSITNAVGWLLPQVVEKYGLDIEDVCWIEHYAWPGEPERFDLVTLHNGSPNWQSLALEQVEVLAGVEL